MSSQDASNTLVLMPGTTLLKTDEVVYASFEQSRPVLSSAILNGGFCEAEHFLNMRVDKDGKQDLEEPALTLQRLSDELGCKGLTVGMMTAASMNSLRIEREKVDGEYLAVLVTTGLQNARRAGDVAEYRSLESLPRERGTINLAVITSARLAQEAMVEMVAVATEAKAAVLHELEVISPVSGLLATGTGTDAIAIFGGYGEHPVRFAGKHTILGERLGHMVMAVIRRSVAYKTEAGV